MVWYGYNAGYLTADVMMCVAAGPGTNCLHCMQPWLRVPAAGLVTLTFTLHYGSADTGDSGGQDRPMLPIIPDPARIVLRLINQGAGQERGTDRIMHHQPASYRE